MREKDGYVEILIDSYEEFIELIRPDRKNLQSYLQVASSRLLYRGHSDDSWKLESSLFRKNSHFDVYKDLFHNLYNAHLSKLRSFVQACDKNGVVIPYDSKKFREKILNTNKDSDLINKIISDSTVAPSDELYELLALAQHYGVATELLDWSYSPLVACLFMVLGVIDKGDIEGKMSLWIFNPELRNLLNSSEEPNIFEIVEVPKGFNRNIAAQDGCFTLVRQKMGNHQKLNWCESEQRFKTIKLLNELIAEKGIREMLLKITVPKKLAADIFKYCEAYGVTLALLYGGAEGAAKYANAIFALDSFKSKLSECAKE